MKHLSCRQRKHISLSLLLALAFVMTSCLGKIDFPDDLKGLSSKRLVLYNISGTVTDEKGAPLQDIQIILTAKYLNTSSAYFEKTDWPIDTVGSAADGSFFASSRQVICPYLEAVASDPASRYQPDTLIVGTSQTGQTTDIALPTISLKKK